MGCRVRGDDLSGAREDVERLLELTGAASVSSLGGSNGGGALMEVEARLVMSVLLAGERRWAM